MNSIIRTTALLITCFFLCLSFIKSQVGIGTISPHGSAILELSSEDKGLLIPRIQDLDVSQIQSPAQGLLIFNETFAKFQYYDGFQWLDIKVDDGLSTHTMISNTMGDVSVQTEENLVEKRITFTSSFEQVMVLDTGVANISPPVTLGDNPFAIAKSRLDVEGRIKIGDDDISSPEQGMMRWNSTTEDFEGFDGNQWKSLTKNIFQGAFGNPVSQSYPSETNIAAYSSIIYNYGRLAAVQEKFAYTTYDVLNDNTIITVFTPNQGSFSFPQTASFPTKYDLQHSEDWMTYKRSNEILSWEYTSFYNQRPNLAINSGGKYSLVSDGKIVTVDPDAVFSYVTLYEYDQVNDVWSALDDDVSFSEQIVPIAKDDNLILISYVNNTVQTFDLSTNELNEIDEYTYPYILKSAIVVDSHVIATEEYDANNNSLLVSFRRVENLAVNDLEILIKEQMWGEDPLVTMTFHDDLLAIGIRNARNEQGVKCGKVLMYKIQDGSATKISELYPSQAQEDMQFGRDITITDDEIKVNAPFFDYNGISDAGILFTFERNE